VFDWKSVAHRAYDHQTLTNGPSPSAPHKVEITSSRHRLKVGLVDNRKLRVVVADDHPMGAKCEVIATASDGKSALQCISELDPDVAVLDLSMPGLSGLEVTRELMSNGRKPAVVICSAHVMPEIVEAIREAGASGFVSKHRCTQDLLPAIEAAASGQSYFPAPSMMA
jgi:DNA-binding NarL/FixJ family response regulator